MRWWWIALLLVLVLSLLKLLLWFEWTRSLMSVAISTAIACQILAISTTPSTTISAIATKIGRRCVVRRWSWEAHRSR